MTAIFKPTTMILPGVKIQKKLQKNRKRKAHEPFFLDLLPLSLVSLAQFPLLPFNAGRGVKIQRPDNSLPKDRKTLKIKYC